MNVTIASPSCTLRWVTPDSSKQIESAGRVCYKSEDRITEESAEKFVEMISKNGHDAVIEHACASFLWVTDRGITHELVRHRIASYCQESTRYVNYDKKSGLQVIPPLGLSVPQYETWFRAMQHAADAYEDLIRSGCTPQQARDVLPTCTKADIVITANFREFKHIVKMRNSTKAHPKIQILAKALNDILQRECPAVFGKPS